jgi:hypothetical protein
MTRRERVLSTLSHREPDRLVLDFGATSVTGIHVTCVRDLREFFGLESRPVKVAEPYQMLGEVEDDLRDAMGIDTTALPALKTIFGFRNENWKEYRTPWGQDVLVSEHFQTSVDPKGDVLIYPEGDRTALPSGRMPSGGFFFDSIIRQEPLDEDRLDPEENLEEFQPLSAADLAEFAGKIESLAGTDRAIVANVGGTAFGDIALVPAPFLKRPRGIRDIGEWYMATVERPDYIHRVFARQCEIALDNLARAHRVLGDRVDVLFVCGTDFGTQTSSFCSPATFDSLYAPYYRQINDWVHRNTRWKTFKHSCGAVEPFMRNFIAAGFDIINPVQCSATGMDPETLKERYGKDIVFWGGGINTQHTLPFGTPDQVREEVLERCRIFAPGGGFVFNSIHNVQAGTPVENLVALLDTVREFNGE